MSKLSKRAISTLVIAILLISTIASILPLSYATHTSSATVAFTSGASKVIGGASSLDVVVSNAGPDPISTVVIDFTLTDFTVVGEGALPSGWTGSGVSQIQTYTGGTIASGANVKFVPTVTNPLLPGVATNPVVKTTDDGVKATLTKDETTTYEIFYQADVAGVAGNLISIAYINPGASGTLSVAVVDQAIAVTLATDLGSVITSTAPEVVAEINIALSDAAVLVDASTTQVGVILAAGVGAPEFLSGGSDATTDYATPVTGTLTIDYTPETDFSIDYVIPSVDVVYDQTLIVFGSGVTSGSTVNVYWDFVTAASLLNVTTGLASGDFECEVSVPSAVYGDHYIWAKDMSTGLTTRSEAIYVIPKITLSPSSGLKGDEVLVKGYGFSDESDIDITFSDLLFAEYGTDETDDLGYFEYTFDVGAVEDDTYTVTATETGIPSASADFIVGAAITLDKDVGPAGTIVKVDGRGFTDNEDITIDSITLVNGDSYEVATKDVDDEDLEFSDGTFSVYIVIPSASEGEYYVTVTDNGAPAKTASAAFEVDGETSITVTPEYGTPGTLLTVKGYNFTRISGTEVTLKLGDRTAEATTDSSGSFTGTIVIPPSDLGEKYDVIANDTRLCHASDKVLVTIIFLQLSDYSAPVGSDVILMGSGFTEGGGEDKGQWNATFGDLKLILTEDITAEQTYFSKTFHVPSLPSGTYPIGVYDVVREITVFIDFTVTDQAALSVSRAAIPNGYNLTIEGINFAEDLDDEVDPVFKTTWWIYNSTDAWDINENVTYGGDDSYPTTDEDGEFTGYYKIPKFLELGTYTINCTTVSNAPSGEDWEIIQTAEVDIEIVPEEVVIHIGSPSYARGQTITFVIKTTLKKEPFHLGIKDPEGSEFFNSTWNDEEDDDSWKILGSWFYIPSNLQIDKNTDWLYTLPTDATPGTWTYSFWDENKEYANGTFQVTHLTETEQLRQDIGEVMAGMEGIGTSVDDLATTVAGVSGASAEAVAAAAAAAAAAAEAQAAAEAGIAAVEDMSEISQDALDAANNAMSAADAAKDAADAGLDAANAAQTTAQQAADAADNAAEAAEGAKSAASGLTGLVYGAIGASLIAALAAIVSLMQISRRIAG